MKKIILIAIISILSLNLTSCSKKEEDIPRVVILAFSGIRKSDFIYLDSILKPLYTEGTHYTHLINYNSQMHIPSFQAALSGVDYPWMAFGDQLLHPSIFQYVMEKYPSLENDRFWAIGAFTMSQMRYSADKKYHRMPLQLSAQPADMKAYFEKETLPSLKDLLSQQELDFFKRYSQIPKGWPYWDSFGQIYRNIVTKIIKQKKPYILFAATGEAESGHYGNWARYVQSIKRQAQFMVETWKYLQEDPFYRGKTYFIILTDHFRDQYYMDHNEDSGKKKTRNWMYLFGPGVEKNRTFDRLISHTDLFATLSSIYKITPHQNQGKPLHEILINAK